jgi:hypothetical protein
MQVLIDHKIISSFVLFVTNQILSKGNAYTNASGLFYPVATKESGLYAYAAPFRQMVYDTSISGANVMTGVYLNNHPVSVGQSGLLKINHNLGTVYFTGALPANTVVSGNYSIADFSINLTDAQEYKLLYETKYVRNSKYNQTLSGLPYDVKTVPAIFIKPINSENKPFAFARLDDNSMDFRCVVIGDSEFMKLGACNILKNLNYQYFPLVSSTPLDKLGNFTGQAFNYSGLSFDTGRFPLVTEARMITVPRMENILDNINTFHSFVDMTVSTVMSH